MSVIFFFCHSLKPTAATGSKHRLHIHGFTNMWTWSSLYHSKPGKAGQSLSSPWRWFWRYLSSLEPPNPQSKKKSNKIRVEEKKIQPNFIACVWKLLLGLCDWVYYLAPLLSSWVCPLLSAIWVSDTHSQGLPVVPRVCREFRILRDTLSIYKYCIYDSHTNSCRGRLVSLQGPTAY